MALPTITVNAGTGSDTAASGAGPATALFGTAAATAASTVVTLLVDNPDLSGVATDGSAVIWIASSSGIRWSKITAINNTAGVKTVTVAVAFANTESGKNWGIGGKIASLPARLFLDLLAGWTVNIDDSSTYTWTVARLFGASGDITSGPIVLTSTSGTRPTITSSTTTVNLIDLNAKSTISISNIQFTHTGASRGNGIVSIAGACIGLYVSNCVFDGCRCGIDGSDINVSFNIQAYVYNCEAKNCTRSGFDVVANAVLDSCYIHANVNGVIIGSVGSSTCAGGVVNCLIVNNTSQGVLTNATGAATVWIRNCVLAGNTSDGVKVPLNGASMNIFMQNCILDSNGGYGFNFSSATVAPTQGCRNNAYRSNTSGARNGITAGAGDVTLTADPFTNSGGNDWSLNTTAGGGAACRAAGIPGVFVGASTTGYQDIGAAQHANPASGGLLINSGMTGGLRG